MGKKTRDEPKWTQKVGGLGKGILRNLLEVLMSMMCLYKTKIKNYFIC